MLFSWIPRKLSCPWYCCCLVDSGGNLLNTWLWASLYFCCLLFLLCFVSVSVFGTIQRRLACPCASVDTHQSRSVVKFYVAQFQRCCVPFSSVSSQGRVFVHSYIASYGHVSLIIDQLDLQRCQSLCGTDVRWSWWLKMVETKMFVDNGMFLQMKIIPTIWPHKNMIFTREIGGFIQTRQVPILCQWSTGLTLNKHCLPCSNWNRKKKELYKRSRTLAEINNAAKLVAEQDVISGLETIGWESHSWKHLSLIVDERIINLQRTKIYVFSDSVLCLGKIHQNPDSNEAWEERIEWITSSQSYRDFDGVNGEPTEFEWNIFPGFDTLQLSRLGETPANFTGRILFMSMFNDISCWTKDNEQECLAHARVVSLYARKFGTGQWSFIGPGSKKKWYSIKEDSPQGIWDNIAEKMLVEFADSGCPIFRATTPLSRGQLRSKGHGKLSIHFGAAQETIDTIFRIIVSANQLSLYGAVAEMCEEYESLHGRSGRPDMVMWHSIVLSAIKTEVSLDCDDPAYQNFLLQQYEERIENCHNKIDWVNFVWMQDSWVLLKWDSISWQKTLEIWHNFMQWLVVNTLFQGKMDHHNQEDGSRETKIGPVLEFTTSCLHGKHGVEIRIWSLNGDNTHSWLEFLMDQINLWWIRITTTQKFLKISSKNTRYNWRWRILHAVQRQEQNHKEGNLLAIHQGSFRWTEGIGLILNQGNILSLRTKFRRK